MTDSPATLRQLRAFVLSQWSGNDAAMVADAVLSRAAEVVRDGRLPYGAVARMVGRDVDEAVMGGITILTASRVATFDVVFMLCDGHEAQPSLLLSRAAASAAMQRGWLEHPVTGERVEDWEARAYPCLEPRAYLRELLAREDRLVPAR